MSYKKGLEKKRIAEAVKNKVVEGKRFRVLCQINLFFGSILPRGELKVTILKTSVEMFLFCSGRNKVVSNLGTG